MLELSWGGGGGGKAEGVNSSKLNFQEGYTVVELLWNEHPSKTITINDRIISRSSSLS